MRYIERPLTPATPPQIIEIPVAAPTVTSVPEPEILVPRPLTASAPQSIDTAIGKSTIQPEDGRFLNGHQIYPYAAGRFYRVITAPERITDIQLQPGEELLDAGAGDSFRWLFEAVRSGSGQNVRTHIFLKPTEENINTNLIITTTKRVYHLELLSSLDATPHHSVSWSYPGEQRREFKKQIAELYATGRPGGDENKSVQADNHLVVGSPGQTPDDALARLNFNWAIEGGRGQEWLPTEIYDDGARVILRFRPDIARKKMPVLSLLTRDNQIEIVNYTQQGSVLIVPHLFERAVLYISQNPQDRAFVTRTGIWTEEK